MRIAIVGGIYGRERSYRDKHSITPETVLSASLRERGYDVTEIPHREYSIEQARSFDIVHVHHVARGGILAAWSRNRPPFIFTSHSGRMLCNHDISMGRRLLYKYIVKRADVNVALSEFERVFLEETMGIEQNRIRVIPNGIPFEAYPLTIRDTFKETLSILYVGQLIPLKGVDVLLKAVALLTIDFEVLLIYQNKQLELELRRLAKELNIEERVHFLGLKSPSEISEISSRCDVQVLPTRAEALPSVITESLLSGLPVIASAIGAIPDQLGQYGMSFPVGNHVSLSKQLMRFWENRSFYVRLGPEMNRYAKARFSVQQMIDKHVELYEEMVKAKGSASFISRDLWDVAVPLTLKVKEIVTHRR